jgi:PBP/GOBP family
MHLYQSFAMKLNLIIALSLIGVVSSKSAEKPLNAKTGARDVVKCVRENPGVVTNKLDPLDDPKLGGCYAKCMLRNIKVIKGIKGKKANVSKTLIIDEPLYTINFYGNLHFQWNQFLTLIDWKNDETYKSDVRKCIKANPVQANNVCESVHKTFVCIRKTDKQALNNAFDRYYNTNANDFLQELLALAATSKDLKFRTE